MGNGTSDNARSNARTLDWNGNEVLAGKLTVGAAPSGDMDVTTKGYVDTGLADKQDSLDFGTPTAEDVGKALMPKTIENGEVTKWEFGEAGMVDDVQINGTSIVSNKVANIPIASTSQLGAVKIDTEKGIQVDANGTLLINPAMGIIKKGADVYKPIVPYFQHYATFYGLTKAAGVDMASSSNPVGTYTPEAKTAIQSMLGIDSAIADAISGITGFDFSVVQELPQTGVKGVIYLVAHSHDTDDGFDEYIWITDKFEKLGHCDVDLTDYVRNTDYATKDTAGVVKVRPAYGINIGSAGYLTVAAPSDVMIKNASSAFHPIVTTLQHQAAFYGLAKAAGDTTQSASANAVGTYTDEAKTAIKSMLGVADGAIDIGTVETLPSGSDATASITGDYNDMSLNLGIPMGETGDSGVYVGSTTPTDEDIVVWVDTSQTDNPYVEVISGTAPVILGEPNFRYVCGEVYTIDITPPSAGTIDVRFTSGSTPAVLTLPDTVTMPEWWVGVEANRTYDFCIIDGTYVGVMSWPV